MNKRILVTGGAGYIGSHFLEAWLESPHAAGSRVDILDDLSGGHRELIGRLESLFQQRGASDFCFDTVNLLDEEVLQSKILQINPDIVFHFAGKISVAESVQKPDLYFNSNVKASRNLLNALSKTHCRKLVFSSTAAVYEAPPTSPETAYQIELAAPPVALTEDSPVGPASPYGENKLQVEKMIEKASRTWGLRAVVFRYFNAAGASLSGRLGEWHEPETHLIPLLLQSAVANAQGPGETAPFKVFGDDYPTPDGTCIRDYIHVSDLAQAHLLAMDYLDRVVPVGVSWGEKRQAGMSSLAGSTGFFEMMNLGTHHGVSVKEMLEAASALVGYPIPHTIAPRRSGDVPVLVASSARAQQKLGWKPQHSDLETILKTAHRWLTQSGVF